MQCQSCGTINPTQARFCMGCGLRLVQGLVCGECKTLLPPHAHYCYHCGAFVSQPGSVQIMPVQTYVAQPVQPVQPVPMPMPGIVPQAPVPAMPSQGMPQQVVAQTAPAPAAAQAAAQPAESAPAAPAAITEPSLGQLGEAKQISELLPSLKRFLPSALYEPLERRPNAKQIEAARDHLSALLETTKTYVPRPVITHAPKPGQPAGGMVQGVFLFCDVSGFTPLSEKLKKQGQAGAERITDIINSLFTELVKVLFDHGGALLKFGGDAMLGVFPAENDAEMQIGAMRAAQAAMVVQEVMQQEKFAHIETGDGVSALKVKCGISSGRYFAAHIGTPSIMAYVTTGHTVNRAEQAEGHAEPGQVSMSRETYELIQDKIEVGPVEKEPSDEFVRLLSAPPLDDAAARFVLQEPPAGETMAQITYLVWRMERISAYLSSELISRIVTNPGNPRITPDHRQVTVMFANYVGISDLIEDMGDTDPDLIVNRLNDYFVHMADVVERYEGTLARMDQYAIGDRLVIFFGAPRAHEDDPVRAIYTALDMQKSVRDNFAALQTASGIYRFRQRIGVNTGMLFAGNAGAPNLRQEYTLMGDDINMAARLMSKAGWQEIFISRKTQERVSAFFDMEDMGELKVKGKEIRIPTFKVLGRRGEVGRTRGIGDKETPLIGRTAELAALEKCGQTLLKGRGQIVSIIGDSGLGKSRLSGEFRQIFYAMEGAEKVRWIAGQSLSFSEGISYWLVAQIFRGLLGLGPEDRQEDVLFNLWEKAETLLGKETAREVVPFLANMLGIELKNDWANWVKELDPKVRQKQTFWAAREFLGAIAEQQPLVILLDDLHWADEASLALLEDLLSITDQSPVFVLTVFRALRQKGSWKLRDKADRDFHHRYSEVTLEPLTREESINLLAGILPGAEFSEEVINEIFEKSAGNPFYLEEVTRTLIDSEVVVPQKNAEGKTESWKVDETRVQNIRVPDSLQGAIVAHIDRLTEDARQALQMAAVIGRQFQVPLLRSMGQAEAEVGMMLAQLERHNLIHPISASEDDSYIFPDALVQEVAYENLLMQRRQDFHLKIAQAMESMLGSQAETECELLAHHYSRSNDPQRALPYLETAGRKAQAQFANETAIKHYTDIIAVLNDKEEQWEKRFEMLNLLQQVNGLAGRNADRQANIDTMKELADSHADAAKQAIALNKLADLCQWTGRYDDSISAAQQALELATQLDDPRNQAEAMHTIGVVRYYRADYAGAKENLEKAVNIRQQLNDQEGAIWSLMYNYMIHIMQGEYDLAKELNMNAQESADARQDWFQKGIHLTNAGRISLRLGDYDIAQQQLEISLEMKTRVGDWLGRGFSLFAIGQAHYARGNYEQARQSFQASLDLRKTLNDRRGLSYSVQGLALVDMAEEHYDEAIQNFEQALAQRKELGLKGEAIADLSFMSQAFLKAGNPEKAREASTQAVQLLQTGIKVEEEQAIYLNHYRVLAALDDPIAPDALAQAEKIMQSQAEQIAKEDIRTGFLNNVRVNREISEARKNL